MLTAAEETDPVARIVFFCRVERRLLDTVEFYRQDIEALQDLGHEVEIATRLREIPWDFDILFIWWWTHAALPVLLARFLGRRSIVTGTFNFRVPDAYEGVDYFRRAAWQRWLIRYAVTRADLNVFVSRLELEHCRRHFGIASGRYCPHVVATDYSPDRKAARELAIFNLCWSQRSNLRRKGIPELLEAVSRLRARGIQLPLYLAGHEGDGSAWLRELVAQNELDGQVELMGELSRDEKIRMLQRCELYVQPSWYEGFGLAQAEAMACGACVVTSRVGAIEEVVGDAGRYVEAGDVEGLAREIERVLVDRDLRVDLQERAVRRIRERFSPERKRAIFARLLAEISGG